MKQTYDVRKGFDPGERMKPPSPAKYFFALTSLQKREHRAAESILTERMGGSIDLRSEIYCFSEFSRYYEEELGGRCWKYLVSLEELLPVDQLVAAKLVAEEVEREFTELTDGSFRRTVNIDPGYLNGWQVVLSTVKNHSHRLYLEQGIYGELTLLYREGDFQSLPWTYPDYASPPVLDFLRSLRSRYSTRIKAGGRG